MTDEAPNTCQIKDIIRHRSRHPGLRTPEPVSRSSDWNKESVPTFRRVDGGWQVDFSGNDYSNIAAPSLPLAGQNLLHRILTTPQ